MFRSLCMIVIILVSLSTHCMQEYHSDDENIPAEMLSSWIIVSSLQPQTHEDPADDNAHVVRELETLCTAARECSLALHDQLLPLFKNCNLPMGNMPINQNAFFLINDESPATSLLESIYKEDYSSSRSSSESLDSLVQNSRTPSPTMQETTGLLRSIVSYPLYPLNLLLKKVTHSYLHEKPHPQPHHVCVFQEYDPRMINHNQYQQVLKRGTELIKSVTASKQTASILTQLKKQLLHFQKNIALTLEEVESSRESFNTLLGCIIPHEVSLSDSFLLQFAKLGQHQASLETMLADFKLPVSKVTDVMQEQFCKQWKKIQESHRAGTISDERFNTLRQYTYMLQNGTARFMTQSFIDGTINSYGMTQEIAVKRGLTAERIETLTSELSNCKDFLLKLNKAFTDSINVIDTKLS